MRRLPILLAWLAALLPAAALAAPVALCGSRGAELSADGRMLGHLRYGEVSSAMLVATALASLPDKPCLMHRDAAVDLRRLVQAARAAGITGIRGISCFRSVERQRQIFCGSVSAGRATVAQRARSVGPPGFSEHATGYGLDFGLRPLAPGCPDVEACIARTRAGRWLLDNAPEYGFELSFPAGNAQGVTWEPWHWRWVGPGPEAPGAAAARALFARARAQFAAYPAVGGAPLVMPTYDVAPSSVIDSAIERPVFVLPDYRIRRR